jgi:DNA-binding transcriptional MerR regulator/effector-binding domain-containing protein
MTNLLPIGRFSQLTRLSKKALRFYDEAGILKPVLVDNASGYRYYSLSQLNDAEQIRQLRELGLALEVIRAVLHASTPEERQALLQQEQQRLRSQILTYQQALEKIESLSTQTSEYVVSLKTVEAQPYVAVRKLCSSQDVCGLIFEAQQALLCEVKRLGLRLAGPSVVVYHESSTQDAQTDEQSDTWDVEVCQPYNAEWPVEAQASLSVGELAPATVAFSVHAGFYDGFLGLERAYQAVWQWIRQHGYETAGPAREIYLFHPGNTENPTDYRTEIAWPIR